jgi:O-methyltransferase
MLIKRAVKKAARLAGLDVRRYVPQAQGSAPPFPDIPDGNLYVPFYSPWWSADYLYEYSKIKPYTLVSEDRSYILATLATQSAQLDGEVWECGVYKGGTAMLLAERIAGQSRTLRLFDTFAGMPETDAVKDLHKAGDFADTSLESVKQRVSGDFVRFHQGLIPETFQGLESSRIAFAHVDVDIYKAVQACCEFIFPRLCAGGIMVFDDYGFPSCPGARAAVDEYFRGTGVQPLAMPTGQAIVFKPVASPRRDPAVQSFQHETQDQPA